MEKVELVSFSSEVGTKFFYLIKEYNGSTYYVPVNYCPLEDLYEDNNENYYQRID